MNINRWGKCWKGWFLFLFVWSPPNVLWARIITSRKWKDILFFCCVFWSFIGKQCACVICVRFTVSSYSLKLILLVLVGEPKVREVQRPRQQRNLPHLQQTLWSKSKLDEVCFDVNETFATRPWFELGQQRRRSKWYGAYQRRERASLTGLWKADWTRPWVFPMVEVERSVKVSTIQGREKRRSSSDGGFRIYW